MRSAISTSAPANIPMPISNRSYAARLAHALGRD